MTRRQLLEHCECEAGNLLDIRRNAGLLITSKALGLRAIASKSDDLSIKNEERPKNFPGVTSSTSDMSPLGAKKTELDLSRHHAK